MTALMIYSLAGKLIVKKSDWAVVETSGAGFKVLISERASRALPKTGSRVKLFCHLHSSENDICLYGFLSEEDLKIFELLTSINGIGPKAALKVLGVMKPEQLLAAIKSGRSDLLIKAAGVGSKKANRIILELKDKISKAIKLKPGDDAELESDLKLEGVLKSLGYRKEEIKNALRSMPAKAKTIEEKLKIAFKNLG